MALISATKGTGFDAIDRFLTRLSEPAEARHEPMQLPVLQTAASCHQWATQVSSRTKYKAPASPGWTRRLDAVLLHKIWGPVIFLAVVIGVFQVVFAAGLPLSDWLTRSLPRQAPRRFMFCPGRGCRFCCAMGFGMECRRFWFSCLRSCCFSW